MNKGTAQHKAFADQKVSFTVRKDAFGIELYYVRFSTGERTSMKKARFLELFDIL